MELERFYNTLKLSMEESDARMASHETQLRELKNSSDSLFEKLQTQLNLRLQ